MIIERRSSERGRVKAGWLDSHHTFSFGQYYDPEWMGFGPLRVINEDRVDPGAGFAEHGHANMEILSYVLSGALSHKDSAGGGGVIRAGELQWMSAGHGVQHSEFNASDSEPVHFLQIWIQPDRVNATPAYAQRGALPPGAGWRQLASPDGADGSLVIRQDARMYTLQPAAGAVVEHALSTRRRYWLQVVRGEVEVNGRALVAGDALGYSEEGGSLSVTRRGDDAAEVLLFDLPL
ncbi:pirin family protein [Montanilutibacter psychrotolerans]|uniref:Pirin family protein n=1 Tax=Montanilutibacter psychrotolerans TaxID=1327343 RepID=A0A3M8SMB6_9GAMM|nr:pirin family protein [Lysobacter psychrotolerans]RNF81943.1 pirin family protein [Lysobacter psychrotolerans]